MMGRSPEKNGKNFKYTGTYQEAAKMMKKYCAAYPIEVEKFFAFVLFNYIIGNGDAHLKNFLLTETDSGDFIMSPAYDLVNTNINFPDESRTALDIFIDYESSFFNQNGFYGKEDFVKFSEILEIKNIRSEQIIQEYLSKKKDILSLI